MKIGMIGTLGQRTPPEMYGGAERIISILTEELVKRGHDVTLFASGNSITSAKLISSVSQPFSEIETTDYNGLQNLAMLNIVEAYKRQDEFDILHDHNVYLSLPLAVLSKKPIVMTHHGSINLENRKLFEAFQSYPNPHFVTISKSQAIPLPSLNYIANIYNGLDMIDYPFSETDDGYLLYVGRISPEKGIHHAIRVAEFLDIPLIIAGPVNSHDVDYFETRVKPRLSAKITYVGEVNPDERNKLMSKALCFLHLTDTREPFGLSLIEAMACGCPVLAFNRGAIPEIVKKGISGFVVEDVSELIEAFKKVKNISREKCREYSLTKFNASRMVDEYELVYEKILKAKE